MKRLLIPFLALALCPPAIAHHTGDAGRDRAWDKCWKHIWHWKANASEQMKRDVSVICTRSGEGTISLKVFDSRCEGFLCKLYTKNKSWIAKEWKF